MWALPDIGVLNVDADHLESMGKEHDGYFLELL